MKKQSLGALALAVAAACAAVVTLPASAGNPLFSDKFTADPAVLVDGGRVYLYAGHDEAPPKPEGKDFVMNEWLVYSSCDMKHWTPHGTALRYDVFKWAGGSAWASKAAMTAGSTPAFSASLRWAYHSNGDWQARPVTRMAISDWRGVSVVP